MLRWRFPVAAAIVAALIGLCWLDARSAQPGLWLLPAAVFFTVAATAEMLALARRCGLDPLSGTVYLANLALDFNVYYDSSLLNNAYLQDRTYQLGAGFLIPIPEPSTWLMMLLGILMTVLLRRKEGRSMRPASSPIISMSPRGDP